jgi:hypothetical protein
MSDQRNQLRSRASSKAMAMGCCSGSAVSPSSKSSALTATVISSRS